MNEHEGIKLLTADLTRRRFLQGTGLVGFSAFLAACGTSGTGTQAPPASAPGGASQTPAASQGGGGSSQAPSATLNFANWPLYIDTDENDDTKHKTLEDFKAKYGTTVDYQEVINANDEFFGMIRPALEGGRGLRLGHRRADRLDGRPVDPPRLGRTDGPGQHAGQGREHAGRLQGRQL